MVNNHLSLDIELLHEQHAAGQQLITFIEHSLRALSVCSWTSDGHYFAVGMFNGSISIRTKVCVCVCVCVCLSHINNYIT